MVDNKEKDKFDLRVQGLKGSKPQNKIPSNVWDKDSLLNYKLQITYFTDTFSNTRLLYDTTKPITK